MPKGEPKDVQVTVKVTDVAAQTFIFESSCLTVGDDNHISFNDGDDHSGFRIFYHLEGADGYRFPEDPDEALYVNHGTTCPQSKSKWGQFRGVAVSNQGRTLEVLNKNEKQAKKADRHFAYSLVAKKTGAPPLLLDPGGTNNNGEDPIIGPGGISSNVIVGGIAAAALLAVAFVVLK
jgi:hypothetical protein